MIADAVACRHDKDMALGYKGCMPNAILHPRARPAPSRPRRRAVRFAALLLAALPLLQGCGEREAPIVPPEYSEKRLPGAAPVLRFGVHPLHNPNRLFELYGPIVDAVNRAIPDAELRLEASRDYADFERKLRERELALPNPYQTLKAVRHGYRIIGKVKGDEDFRGIILTRAKSAPGSVRELRGKTLACPARTALAACMMPLLYLNELGLDVRRDLTVMEVGSQESSILNVARGLTDAAATWPPPWRAFQRAYPELAATLSVRWETEPLPNNGLVAREDLPEELGARIVEQLVRLDGNDAGRSLLQAAEIAGFEPANQATYAPLTTFLERYETRLGALPE